MKFAISFGALSERIEEQLKEQGLYLQMEPYRRQVLQKHADQVTDLKIQEILSEREATNARRRILRRMRDNVKPLEALAREAVSEQG